jgi:hypothetical protein
VKIIRSEFLIDALPFNKIKGTPITKAELTYYIKSVLENK